MGLIHLFKATLAENPPTDPAGQQSPATLTETQRVKIPFGLRGNALREFLQRDFENAFGKEFVAP